MTTRGYAVPEDPTLSISHPNLFERLLAKAQFICKFSQPTLNLLVSLGVGMLDCNR